MSACLGSLRLNRAGQRWSFVGFASACGLPRLYEHIMPAKHPVPNAKPVSKQFPGSESWGLASVVEYYNGAIMSL